MKHRFNTHTGFCRIVITVIAIALCVTIGATAANTVRLPGDMDRDGQITPADARIVLRIAVKLEDVNDYMDGPADDPSRPTAMIPGVEDGVLTVAMECAYAPYNWTQQNSAYEAVPIKDSDDYANGYDVMIAKTICRANGWKLEIVRLDWDSLIPAVQTGQVDAVIAGQCITAERLQQVDFAGPYKYENIVCLAKAGSAAASATGKSQLSGYSCTSQAYTIWYDSCLPQIKGAVIKPAKESLPQVFSSLATGDVDFICCDMTTALCAQQAFPDFVILDFFGSGDDFAVDESDVNLGISVRKGNTALCSAINEALTGMTADNFNAIMKQAVAIMPVENRF